MCAPIIPLIATGLGAISSGISTAAAIGQARAQAAAAQANATAESGAAQIAQQNMRAAALQQYRQMAAATGEQRMLAAANGNAAGYGTAGNALNDVAILGQENLARIYAQGNQNLIGADVRVANDLGQAAVANSRADAATFGALVGLGNGLVGNGGATGAGSMFGTALGGASQYASFKVGMGL
jgi:hypothetical protein